jgi:hypothetical protein
MRHEVIVENVGTVYDGPDEIEARKVYAEYAGKYRPMWCDWFADVWLISGNDIADEYCDPMTSWE